MVTAKGLTKKFGDLLILDNIDLHVNAGEFVFLTGPSGSGKTTLLRLILRDLIATTGELLVDGQDVAKIKKSKLPNLRRSIGTVFQDFRLLADRNVLENVALPLLITGQKVSEVKAAVDTALEIVGLTNRKDLFPAQLSGGEIQRVTLARAIVGKPKLILADEPTGNLDPKTAREIVKLLETIHNDLKTTILMATHNEQIVNTGKKRVIKLKGGKVSKDQPDSAYDDE